MGTDMLVLGFEGHFLVSFWKPLVLMVPFVGWAWVISAYYDKHAARFFLPRQMWNAIHLCLGLVAFAVAVMAIPMPGEGAFWIGFGAMVAIMGVDLAAYAFVANRDERVPEEFHIRLDMERIRAAREAKAVAKKQGKVELTLKGPDKQALPVPNADTPEFALRVAAESLVLKALEMRASQLDMAPGQKDGGYIVAYLVDGVRQAGAPLPPADAVKIIDFWKSVGKLDVTDRRRRQSADVNVEKGADKHKLRVVASGATGGMRMTALIDPEKQVKRKAAELGLLENQMAEIKALVEERQGVVLLAAPPDMGRTTTLYSILKMHDAYTSNVQTVEMEPQDSLEGVRQNIFESKAEGGEYSTLVRTILRRDPQVVGVADLPDEQTAKEVARAEVDRCRVYLSIKADNVLAAIQVWTKAVGDPEAAAKVLHGVTAQRLVRKLCINCRQAYQPAPDMLKKLGLPADKVKQLFKKGGQVLIKNKPEVCPVCSGIGYIGQEGLFEVCTLGVPERSLVKAGNLSGLRAELRKKGQPTIQQVALRKAVEGITSVEEVLRVTSEGPGGTLPAPKAPPASAPVGSR